MGKYDNVEVHGEEREKAIADLYNQVKEWGLTLPDVTPLPLHFGLDRFMEVGETEFWIANEEKNGYCGKFLFVFDGQRCPYHMHNMKHETFFIVKGSVCMTMNDEDSILKEGDLLVMPPGVGHSFIGIGPSLILEVSMPSILNDNFFRDKNIGDNGVI